MGNKADEPDSSAAGEAVDWRKAINALGRANGIRGAFDKVSLEHILRRLSELKPVRKEISASFEKAELEFNRLARKYMEFASAVSADFKRRSQMWSMVVGLLLAYVGNINAVLVFQAYLQDKEMTAQVISRLDTLGEDVKRTQQNMEQAAEGDVNEGLEGLQKPLEDIRTTLSSLQALPIGADYFPHSWIIAKLSPPENATPPKKAVKQFEGAGMKLLTWWVATTLTGLMIGLGAPFWFDIAKRLATVRSMFGGQASKEERLGGKDVPADRPAERQALIRTILSDVLEEEAIVKPTPSA